MFQRDQVYQLMLLNTKSVRDLSIKNIKSTKGKYNVETMSLLEPPKEDHIENDNPNTMHMPLIIIMMGLRNK